MSQTIKNKSIAIINASAPFTKANGKEALDVALIFGSFEQKVSLFFQGDGVWQLVDQQSPENLHIKNYLKTFSALTFYDIEDIYVCEKSLNERGISGNFHIENITKLSEDDFAQQVAIHDVVFRF